MSGPARQAADAGDLVTAVATQRPLEEQLRAAGLQAMGPCDQLSALPGMMLESPLLHDFTSAEADILGRAMVRVRAKPGQTLIAEDDPSDWMLLLLSGTVDIGKRKAAAGAEASDRDETTRLAVLRSGAVVGEMSMLDGEPRYASCWALSDVEVAVLTRPALADLINSQPGVGAKVLVKLTQLLAQRLRNTSNQLVRQLQRASA